MAKAIRNLNYTVLRDTREQRGWIFPQSGRCQGTEVVTLRTGDYGLKGYEDLFVIERKGGTAEFATNIFEKRFTRELDRLDEFKHAYLFLEFEFDDICIFPVNSGIPTARWNKLKVTPQLFMAKLHEIQIAHPSLRVCLVGRRGREVASSLFKRIVEKHG